MIVHSTLLEELEYLVTQTQHFLNQSLVDDVLRNRHLVLRSEKRAAESHEVMTDLLSLAFSTKRRTCTDCIADNSCNKRQSGTD